MRVLLVFSARRRAKASCIIHAGRRYQNDLPSVAYKANMAAAWHPIIPAPSCNISPERGAHGENITRVSALLAPLPVQANGDFAAAEKRKLDSRATPADLTQAAEERRFALSADLHSLLEVS
jgi:hypothetical protein